jgi:hypothetical protein
VARLGTVEIASIVKVERRMVFKNDLTMGTLDL